MIELVLIVVFVLAIIGFVLWANRTGKKAGHNELLTDTQAQAIKDLQARNEIDLATPVDGASDRLRNSRWNRDNALSSGSPDHDR